VHTEGLILIASSNYLENMEDTKNVLDKSCIVWRGTKW